MKPLQIAGDPGEFFERLRIAVSKIPRGRIITANDNYLHAEVTSALFRFVDDVEFFMDREQRVIHFRSASRVGSSDLGVNRGRMNAITTELQATISTQDGSSNTDR